MGLGWRHIYGTLRDSKWLRDGALNTPNDVQTSQIDQLIN